MDDIPEEYQGDMPETESDGDKPRKPPRPTAVDVSGHGFSHLKSGVTVTCEILGKVRGGYAVMAYFQEFPGLHGYMPSNVRHNIGEEILAIFIRVDRENHKVIIADRFSGHKPLINAV